MNEHRKQLEQPKAKMAKGRLARNQQQTVKPRQQEQRTQRWSMVWHVLHCSSSPSYEQPLTPTPSPFWSSQRRPRTNSMIWWLPGSTTCRTTRTRQTTNRLDAPNRSSFSSLWSRSFKRLNLTKQIPMHRLGVFWNNGWEYQQMSSVLFWRNSEQNTVPPRRTANGFGNSQCQRPHQILFGKSSAPFWITMIAGRIQGSKLWPPGAVSRHWRRSCGNSSKTNREYHWSSKYSPNFFLLQATHRGLHFAQLQSGNGAMVKRLIDGAPPVCEATVFFDYVCQVNVDRYRTRHFSHTSTGGQPCPHIPISWYIIPLQGFREIVTQFHHHQSTGLCLLSHQRQDKFYPP